MDAASIMFELCILAVPVTFLIALVLSFAVKRQPLRHNARVLASISGGVMVAAILGTWLLFRLMLGPSPPTLVDLEKSFRQQRADLETILQMSNEDASYSRIDPTFLRKFPKIDPSSGQIDPDAFNATMPSIRWNQYRHIYSRNHIRQGIERDSSGDAFIRVQSEGLLKRGHGSGYVFCNLYPAVSGEVTFRYEPCTSTKDAGSHRFAGEQDGPHEGYAFKKLADHWYAYDQGPS